MSYFNVKHWWFLESDGRCAICIFFSRVVQNQLGAEPPDACTGMAWYPDDICTSRGDCLGTVCAKKGARLVIIEIRHFFSSKMYCHCLIQAIFQVKLNCTWPVYSLQIWTWLAHVISVKPHYILKWFYFP